ncbi:MAG: histidine--tRNA ligase [Methanosarcinales archaeon]|nr:MAG: histidine--tRNA ligase [Methanosarcinales archaeon]
MKVQRPRGTRDFLPIDMAKRRFIECQMREIVERWGYQEVQTPTFEDLELFTIKSGEAIVEEIYAFKDKGGRDLALRPELTAPIVRMYVNKLQAAPKPLRFYYFGNCFRYERPQKARFREFWHFGAELIGSNKPEADAEVIALASAILDEICLDGDLRIGHLGVLRILVRSLAPGVQRAAMRCIDKKDVQGLTKLLKESDAAQKDALLSLIKSKSTSDAREIVGDIPELRQFEDMLNTLDVLGVQYSVDFGIARGLEYYTGMVFEIYAKNLGAQNQICGGGAYRLAHLLDGKDVPSTGFAFGFDRVIEALDIKMAPQKKVVVITRDETRKEALKIANSLRRHVPTHVDVMERSVTAQISYANAIGASYAVIVGPKELQAGKVTLKDMETGEQELLALDEVIRRIA